MGRKPKTLGLTVERQRKILHGSFTQEQLSCEDRGEKREKEREGGGGRVVRAEVNTEYAQTANALNNRTCRKAHTCCEWNVPRGSFPFQTSSIHNYSSTNSVSVAR